ncbi:hypothetical protein [Alicyclobacillus hesperidum]|nr:hypothetical protein [Alicyclobacillus hesperidum]
MTKKDEPLRVVCVNEPSPEALERFHEACKRVAVNIIRRKIEQARAGAEH